MLLNSVCPNSLNKELTRILLAEIAKSINAKEVFSLIGTDAGFVSKLPKSIKVVSAETNKNIFKFQKEKFSSYELHFCPAQNVLFKSFQRFDIIWLDLLGPLSAESNLPSITAARMSVKEGGFVAITSGTRRGKGVRGDYETFIKNRGFNIMQKISYLNDGTRMKFYLCT